MNESTGEFGTLYLIAPPKSENNRGEDPVNLLPEDDSLETEPQLKTSKKTKRGYLSVVWNGQQQKILKTSELLAADIHKYKQICKSELLMDMDWNLCGHYPAYAIELFSHDLLYHKTSFCFDCDNYVAYCQGEVHLFQMRNVKLLDWLKGMIPLPENYSEL